MGNEEMNYNWSTYVILIADDEEANYILTRRIIRDTGAKTLWAHNGKEAVEEATKNSYDLILMDIRMPEMDGIEATRTIRNMDPDVPIIMQTAYAIQSEKDKAEEAGCTDFFVKPIMIDEFLFKIDQHLRKYTKSTE